MTDHFLEIDVTELEWIDPEGPLARKIWAHIEADAKGVDHYERFAHEIIAILMSDVIEALRFYANPETYDPSIIQHATSCSIGDTPAEEDAGERAREAIAKIGMKL